MSITITPINGEIGATITGATGSEVATPEVASQVQAAIDRYGVVVFPDLHISDDDLAALARLLGEVVLPLHGRWPTTPRSPRSRATPTRTRWRSTARPRSTGTRTER